MIVELVMGLGKLHAPDAVAMARFRVKPATIAREKEQ